MHFFAMSLHWGFVKCSTWRWWRTSLNPLSVWWGRLRLEGFALDSPPPHPDSSYCKTTYKQQNHSFMSALCLQMFVCERVLDHVLFCSPVSRDVVNTIRLFMSAKVKEPKTNTPTNKHLLTDTNSDPERAGQKQLITGRESKWVFI